VSRIRGNAIAYAEERSVPTFSFAVITCGQPSRVRTVILSAPLDVYAAMIARALRDGSYVVSCFHIAKRTCDSFPASAVIATGAPRRSAIPFAQCTRGAVGRRRYEHQAACPSAHRTCGAPAWVTRVRLTRKPVVFSPGTTPKYEATREAFGNRSTWSRAATSRTAVTGPTPGTVMRRRERAVLERQFFEFSIGVRNLVAQRLECHQHAFKMGQTVGIKEECPSHVLGKLSGVARSG
jgi:hypothetical protein